MSNPSNEGSTKPTLEEMTIFHIRMYEILFISAFFCFIYSLYHSVIILWIVLFCSLYMAYRKLMSKTENLPIDQKAVFITGCDSGIGYDLAKYLLANNFQVFAGCFNLTSTGATELQDMDCPNLHIVEINVTDDESVNQCANIIQESCQEKGLWALVNNAGIDKFGSVEFSTMDMYEHVMNVNYFGTVRVTKALLPLIRKAKGRILNISSCNGKFSAPNRAAYCPSKFAVEAFSDILRMELHPFGVRVCLIEPGHYGGATKILDTQQNILENSLEHMWDSASEDVRQTYGRKYLYHLKKFIEDGIQSSHENTSPIIEAMHHAILNSAPKFRYLIGGGQFLIDINTVLVYAANILPDAVMDFILKYIHLNNWPDPQSLEIKTETETEMEMDL